MLKRVFAVRPQPMFTSVALLVARVVCGVAFVLHGWGKIQNPFGWMGPDAFAPAPLQALAALSEFVGGIAWVLGILTPLASFGIACTMGVAVYHLVVHKGATFLMEPPVPGAAPVPSYEQPATFFCIALVLLACGPGSISLDCRLFGVRGQVSPA